MATLQLAPAAAIKASEFLGSALFSTRNSTTPRLQLAPVAATKASGLFGSAPSSTRNFTTSRLSSAPAAATKTSGFLGSPPSSGDNTGSEHEAKKRKSKKKYQVSYSGATTRYAEKRLGFLMEEFESQVVSINHMLVQSRSGIGGLGQDDILKTKETVYDWIVRFLEGEGYPTESVEDFTEANINDLVSFIIIPIITDFRRMTGRNIRLRREKEIISNDRKTGGREEFIVMDIIGVEDRKYVLVVEAKHSFIGEAKKQCLLSMQDMRGNNGGGVVYGFVTTGEFWQMIRYDGTSFIQTDKFRGLFVGMDKNKKAWMEGYALMVDCIHAAFALMDGGVVEKDVAVGLETSI